MFEKTRVCKALLVAFGGGLAIGAVPALAQTPAPDSQTQRVEITGSSIRRIDAESALPVVVLKRADIERSGATSVVDLLNRLPTIQGATPESSAVGGNTYGFSGVSIHDIGETRTLVLLNGHRLAQFGGQTLTGFAAGFDLNSIPVSAIERVEVLSDGASALYGADAIAGVVNFITKSDTTEGDITIGYSSPKGGAKEKRISATKGFGSLAEDGWNVTATFAHDERTELNATARSFAKTGNILFNYNGQRFSSPNYSQSAIPANIVLDNGANVINPYLIATGSCPSSTFRVTDGADDFCAYDFVSTLKIFPERKRDSFFGSGNIKLGDHQLFADVLISRTKQKSVIAAVPGSIFIPVGSDLWNTYVAPLGLNGIDFDGDGAGDGTLALYRIADLGGRTSDDTAKFFDVALGAKGVIGAWDYNLTYSHSESDVKGNISGYPGALAVANLRASGLLNPFVLPGQQTPEAQAALDAINYKGYWDGGIAKLDTIALRASGELVAMPAGSLSLGTGVNFNQEKFQSKPSPFAQGITTDPVTGELCDPNDPAKPCDQRFGDAAASVPYTANRKSYGAFAELVIPAAKWLEFSTAVRYDHYDDFGNATTAKAGFKLTPTRSLLIRGSVGSGFHAPSVPQVNAAPQSYGVTEDSYACTPELLQVAQSLGAQCRPGTVAQYDVLAGGNATLKPEKSKQATLGFRFEPTPAVSLGLDWWYVAIRDTFGQIDEKELLGNPLQYPGGFTTARDIGTGVTYIALNQGNLNLGKQFSSGIDLDFTGRAKTGMGDITSSLTATYMLREQVQLQPGGPYFSAVGQYVNGGVTFRLQGKWTTSIKAGDWTHTLAVNYKSGWRDEVTEVFPVDDAGNPTGGASQLVQLDIPYYMTFDWQTQWALTKNLVLTAGVLNLLNEDPPFVLSAGGGQQVGYDDRYYDPRGRTLYANLSFKF